MRHLPELLAFMALTMSPALAGASTTPLVLSNDTELMSTRLFRWKYGEATGLAARADIVVYKSNLTRHYRNSKEVSDRPLVVFVNMRELLLRDELLDAARTALANETAPVVMVLAGADWTWPWQRDMRNPPTDPALVKKWKSFVREELAARFWVENLDERFSAKISPLPLGISLREINRQHNKKNQAPKATLGDYLVYANTNPDRPLLASFSGRVRVGPQWEERKVVGNFARKAWAPFMGTFAGDELTHKKFLAEMAKFPFAIAVHGGGNDPNPRVWEALLLGCICIIRRTATTAIYDDLDLPVVQVDGWTDDTVSAKNLAAWHDKYRGHLAGDKRREVLYKLTLEYWWERITATRRVPGG